ncbi:TetR/AcrR family transcriptional regulator [Actinokineospora inagensis]|uniref:TetR/AcrR family transcriptional regulator n=1 Tax=Actinokineospora inagensis TaxID=103730 RepID=UPI00041D137E|nr:TetR/AcrR family transcriptional regulator [Actinokineospora inagensis]
MPDAHDLLWGHRPTPTRGPRRTLTVEHIATTAITIADADGLPATTMQRVAERLDVTKMALYRYVPGKDELVALMIDTALGEPPDGPPAPWRAALRSWSDALFTRFAAHPWALAATIGPRPIGPHELTWLERALAALADTALTGSEAMDTVATLVGHVRGIAQQMAAQHTEAALQHSFATLVEGRADRFPAIVRALSSSSSSDNQDSDNQGSDNQGGALAFGLDRVLDGVELFLRVKANPS